MEKKIMKYYTYLAILGKLRDDGILSNQEVKDLEKHNLETGTLNGIQIQLSELKAKTVWDLIRKNHKEFLKDY